MLKPLTILMLAMSVGCASTTTIRSTPAGATVKSVEGGTFGKTPLVYSDTNIVNQPKHFTLTLEGYEPAPLVIKRDQWDAGRIVLFGIGGLFFFIPYIGILWSADYAPVYDVELKPAGADVSPPPLPNMTP